MKQLLYAASELFKASGYPVQRFAERTHVLILRRALPLAQCVAQVVEKPVSRGFALSGIEVIIYLPLVLSEVLVAPHCHSLAARICRVLVFVAGVVDVVDIIIPGVACHISGLREICIIIHERQRAVILHFAPRFLSLELFYFPRVALYLSLYRYRICFSHVEPACIIGLYQIYLLLEPAVFSHERSDL